MHSLEPDRFPQSQASDPEAVLLALETGRALWGKGEAREAVRWLRRAAERADESGDDARALALARTAAELTTLLELPASIPPPGPATTSGTPWDDFQDKTIVDAPATGLAPRPVVGVAPRTAAPVSTSAQPRPSAPPRPAATTVQSPIMPAPGGNARPRQALRVAVTRQPGSKELSVRVLDEGEKPGAGAREALLVALEPGADFLLG